MSPVEHIPLNLRQTQKPGEKKRIPLSKIIIYCFAVAIFSFCVKYLIFDFRWLQISKIFNNINTQLLLPAALAPIGLWVIRSIRWRILLHNCGESLSFKDIYFCNAIAQAISMITPANSGELLKIEMLKRLGLRNSSSGYGTFVVERVMDLATLVVLGIASLVFLKSTIIPAQEFRIVIIVSTMLLIITLISITFLTKFNFLGIRQKMLLLRQSCGNLSTSLYIVMLSLVSWVIVSLGWYYSFLSIDIHIGFINTIGCMFIVSIVGIISFIPASLGIAEISTVAILISMGQSETHAQAGALVLRLYGIIALTIGLLHFLFLKETRKHNSYRKHCKISHSKNTVTDFQCRGKI